MFSVVISNLPTFIIVMIINIMLGIFYNIGISKNKFDFNILITGILKATIVCISFVGLAYCFDAMGAIVSVASMELNPELILKSAIVLYGAKACNNLAHILGINKKKENTKEDISNKDSGIF